LQLFTLPGARFSVRVQVRFRVRRCAGVQCPRPVRGARSAKWV